MKVFVKPDAAAGFRLWVRSAAGESPAGTRLCKGGSVPAVSFVHGDEQSAIRDAQLLQEYVDERDTILAKARVSRGDQAVLRMRGY